MPAQIRLGLDRSRGHPLCAGTVPYTGSPNCFTNYARTVRVTDRYIPHCLHRRYASTGDPRSYVNFLPTHRNGDWISCGDRADHGSHNVWVGFTWGDYTGPAIKLWTLRGLISSLANYI